MNGVGLEYSSARVCERAAAGLRHSRAPQKRQRRGIVVERHPQKDEAPSGAAYLVGRGYRRADESSDQRLAETLPTKTDVAPDGA